MKQENYFMIDGKKIPMSSETAKSILESQKAKTYEDVAKELFEKKQHFMINSCGEIEVERYGIKPFNCGNYSKNEAQLESIIALNKLCNVAKHLNGDWKPNKAELKIYITEMLGHFIPLKQETLSFRVNSSLVFFKTKELTYEAIDILGEDEIRKALTLNH